MLFFLAGFVDYVNFWAMVIKFGVIVWVFDFDLSVFFCFPAMTSLKTHDLFIHYQGKVSHVGKVDRDKFYCFYFTLPPIEEWYSRYTVICLELRRG